MNESTNESASNISNAVSQEALQPDPIDWRWLWAVLAGNPFYPISAALLLVVLENGLVLVPFILLTQAVLIGSSLAWGLGLAGGILVVLRFCLFKVYFPGLNLPRVLIVIGGATLAGNVVLPAVCLGDVAGLEKKPMGPRARARQRLEAISTITSGNAGTILMNHFRKEAWA